MAKILNKCPLCGNRLQYSRMMSFTYNSILKLNGEPSAKKKKSEAGSLECGFLSCTNGECDFVTDCDLQCERKYHIKIWEEDGKFYYDDTEIPALTK